MDLIEATYAAATGEVTWSEFGERFRAAVGATSATLWTGAPGEVGELVYATPIPQSAVAAYIAHYNRVDPWAQAIIPRLASPASRTTATAYLTDEIVPRQTFRHTEFYADFARRLGMFHVAGTVASIGKGDYLVLGCHRPEDAPEYGEAERQVLAGVLPHLQRAMDLRRRLADTPLAAGARALDALPTAAIVVNAQLRVRHANAAAEALGATGGLLFQAAGGALRLALEHHDDTERLARRVAEVTRLGTAGGSLAARRSAGPLLPVTVMPLPSRLAGHAARVAEAQALVLVRDTQRIVMPSAEMLCDIYGLSPAEAAVALLAAEGSTAEEIARLRGVSPNTVRTQLKSAMAQMDCPSLRHVTRLLAVLGTP